MGLPNWIFLRKTKKRKRDSSGVIFFRPRPAFYSTDNHQNFIEKSINRTPKEFSILTILSSQPRTNFKSPIGLGVLHVFVCLRSQNKKYTWTTKYLASNNSLPRKFGKYRIYWVYTSSRLRIPNQQSGSLITTSAGGRKVHTISFVFPKYTCNMWIGQVNDAINYLNTF